MNQPWKIDIVVDLKDFTISKKFINLVLQSAFLESKNRVKIPKKARNLSILFTDDKRIKELNKIYRDKDYATDVLSFSQIEGENLENSSELGDIVISIQMAKLQASKFGNTFKQEILRLLIHGILHLFGFDHENVPEKDAKEMESLEDKLFNDLQKNVDRAINC